MEPCLDISISVAATTVFDRFEWMFCSPCVCFKDMIGRGEPSDPINKVISSLPFVKTSVLAVLAVVNSSLIVVV